MFYRALADLIVIIHLGYVAFVVVGEILILIGLWRHWGWVKNRWFRIAHLAAIVIIAGESLLNIDCPLTVWEARLRQWAGQQVAAGSFVGSIIDRILFFHAPDWAFAISYVAFALLVAITFWYAPPIWKYQRELGPPVTSLD